MTEDSVALKFTQRSDQEVQGIDEVKNFLKEHIDEWGPNWNEHALVTIRRQTISRILYYNQLYQQIIGIPGCILEFGVQWGATLAQLISLRAMYEPYNHRRHIYGFDTFEGFRNVTSHDGGLWSEGDYGVRPGYEAELERLLEIHESNAPLSHIKKFTLIKGDASETSKEWVSENPHAVVSMAIFDMDLFKPTQDALQAIIPRLTKGSLLVFDELNCPSFPGETEALDEVIGINQIRLNHFPHQPNCAWAVWGS